MRWHLLCLLQYKIIWKLRMRELANTHNALAWQAGSRWVGWPYWIAGTQWWHWLLFLMSYAHKKPEHLVWPCGTSICPRPLEASPHADTHTRRRAHTHTPSTASCTTQMWAKSNEWCMLFTVGLWEAGWDGGGAGVTSHPLLWLWLKIFPKQLMNMQQQGNKPWLKATDLSIVCISTRLSNTSRVL